jgi:hypothetical protein
MSIVWVVWLILIAVSFGAFETYALVNNKTTLSRLTWDASKEFPLLPWLVGVIVGVLATHFWWGGVFCFAPVTV